MIEVDKTNQQQTKPKVYSGLLFIENLRNVKQSLANEFFITYVSFWNDCPESTNSAVDFVFNYMKVSSLNLFMNPKFLFLIFHSFSQ